MSNSDITPWPVSERALAWPEDADQSIAMLRPAPPCYRGRRRIVGFGPLRAVLAFCLSAALLWVAWVLGNLPIWS
jgi:hypothetical protein